ncbi:conserved hypothetical protein [Theileria equi strain WA]|uniref:Mitochondrial carrier protein n=1 Tax=Theileria equi strain WA TaxID=1537102 RepID=L1LFN3_THEEQ|nr:conserved hypothetical protein [Theileria equi strain WA]EKX74237.1 conserved hypothetical protein [Theileria equi strain WA]|eukprot:XP_004833689.1 conserved hypothetical protein [Theileria equi strain WA]
MINVGIDKYEGLKERLRKFNEKKKKKRVTDARLNFTQYTAHVIPLSTQRFILSPFNRSVLFSQIGCGTFNKLFSINNTTPLNILRGSYERFGLLKLWKGTTPHLASGTIFPGIYILSRWVSDLKYIPYNDKRRVVYVKRYLSLFSVYTFSHLFSYPFDVAYTRLATNYSGSVKIKSHLRSVWNTKGMQGFYSGFSLCLMSTATYLLITFPLNEKFQYKLIESVNDEISKHPLLKQNVKSIQPKELKPVELFPFNLIFGSVSAFIARTITYPLDTIRVLYQYDSWKNNSKSIYSVLMKCTSGGWLRLYSGFSMKCVLLVPECLLYGTFYSIVIKSLS